MIQRHLGQNVNAPRTADVQGGSTFANIELKSYEKEVAQWIRQHPVLGVGIALGMGLGLGILLKRVL